MNIVVYIIYTHTLLLQYYLFIIYQLGNIHFWYWVYVLKFFSWWLCSMHAQSSLTLWHHGLCLTGYSVHGIFQAIILEWVAILFFRGSSWPRARTCISCTAGRFFTSELPGKPFPDCGVWQKVFETSVQYYEFLMDLDHFISYWYP